LTRAITYNPILQPYLYPIATDFIPIPTDTVLVPIPIAIFIEKNPANYPQTVLFSVAY